ncbi:MAG: tRNA (adenosine(37)-N6)-threonylcarbamoyltransferase complex dimerization subunit type 1 TsaB [Desulfobacterales bacterium]|nr:tRNA (adenosine(37)-N6)-threonylcarbamoyltransferase complex dimerization subunit type 1 TsaB [Desulfobacterales bacterium]
MRILALDTASRTCSAALMEDGALVAEWNCGNGRTHATHLMVMIDQILRLSGAAISNVDGFAVSRGPGSFTGLRIGISTIKALALSMGKPLVGVSSLEALALQASHFPGLICALLDARKGEVYEARFRFSQGRMQKLGPERVCAPLAAVADIHEPCLFIGDGAVAYADEIVRALGENVRMASVIDNAIRAACVAILAHDRLCAGDADDLACFEPCYIRKSEAEMKRKSGVRIDSLGGF